MRTIVDAVTGEISIDEDFALEPANLPPLTVEDFRVAIQAHVDSTAQGRLYENGVSLASYVASGNPAWAAEAAAFVVWRDAVWLYAYAELARVEAEERVVPTVAELLAELPGIAWPAS